MCTHKGTWCEHCQHGTLEHALGWTPCEWGKDKNWDVLFTCPNYIEASPGKRQICYTCRDHYKRRPNKHKARCTHPNHKELRNAKQAAFNAFVLEKVPEVVNASPEWRKTILQEAEKSPGWEERKLKCVVRYIQDYMLIFHARMGSCRPETKERAEEILKRLDPEESESEDEDDEDEDEEEEEEEEEEEVEAENTPGNGSEKIEDDEMEVIEEHQ